MSADDIADVLAGVTMVDGFTEQAARLGKVHAAAPRNHSQRVVDPAVLDGLRRAAEDAKQRTTGPQQVSVIAAIDETITALARLRVALTRMETP